MATPPNSEGEYDIDPNHILFSKIEILARITRALDINLITSDEVNSIQVEGNTWRIGTELTTTGNRDSKYILLSKAYEDNSTIGRIARQVDDDVIHSPIKYVISDEGKAINIEYTNEQGDRMAVDGEELSKIVDGFLQVLLPMSIMKLFASLTTYTNTSEKDFEFSKKLSGVNGIVISEAFYDIEECMNRIYAQMDNSKKVKLHTSSDSYEFTRTVYEIDQTLNVECSSNRGDKGVSVASIKCWLIENNEGGRCEFVLKRVINLVNGMEQVYDTFLANYYSSANDIYPSEIEGIDIADSMKQSQASLIIALSSLWHMLLISRDADSKSESDKGSGTPLTPA